MDRSRRVELYVRMVQSQTVLVARHTNNHMTVAMNAVTTSDDDAGSLQIMVSLRAS